MNESNDYNIWVFGEIHFYMSGFYGLWVSVICSFILGYKISLITVNQQPTSFRVVELNMWDI